MKTILFAIFILTNFGAHAGGTDGVMGPGSKVRFDSSDLDKDLLWDTKMRPGGTDGYFHDWKSINYFDEDAQGVIVQINNGFDKLHINDDVLAEQPELYEAIRQSAISNNWVVKGL